ncbi:uncharacterized protein LOC114300815 [Camellia sinensis]|uniref:uncharacterized protein LOC114300815 n=1 Tax=Camellia sinensis TaxID=4442 RepID=UPI0010361B70|nr:uncharacterized protein LOC114300815 [Camellia sinensis]
MSDSVDHLADLYIRDIVRLHGVPVTIVSDRDPRFTAQLWFGKRGKLSPRFIGPFEILGRIKEVTYRLALPPPLSGVHDVFHISILRKYEPDPSHVLDWTKLEVDENVSYEERLVRILDTRDQVLRGKTIPLVKVLWRHHGVDEVTWECEVEVREKYPDLLIDV